MLRYFYDSVKLRTEELAELTENSGKEEDLVEPNDAFSHQEKAVFGVCTVFSCPHFYKIHSYNVAKLRHLE